MNIIGKLSVNIPQLLRISCVAIFSIFCPVDGNSYQMQGTPLKSTIPLQEIIHEQYTDGQKLLMRIIKSAPSDVKKKLQYPIQKISPDERKKLFVSIINIARKSHGISSLSYDEEREKVALLGLYDMTKAGSFDHDVFTGGEKSTYRTRVGKIFGQKREKLTYIEVLATGNTVITVLWGFAGSPGHRSGLMDGDYDRIGMSTGSIVLPSPYFTKDCTVVTLGGDFVLGEN